MQLIVFLAMFPFFHASAGTPELLLDCRVQYKKGGELGHRAVALQYGMKNKKLTAVNIDGQAVYSFNWNQGTLLTSVDSERIQISFDANTITWRSNFRDRDFGNGLCVKVAQ